MVVIIFEVIDGSGLVVINMNHSSNKFNGFAAILTIFLLAIQLSHAYWAETISVHVLSKDGLPIQDAVVSVVYQSKDCFTYSEIKKTTNSTGTANFSFLNMVEETSDPKCLDRSYKIFAEFGGYQDTTTGYVTNTDKNYTLRLPYIMHILYIKDASNKPINGANVTFANWTFTSDASGNAYILLPIGMYSKVTVKYGEVSKTVSINPSFSTKSNVSIQVYDLLVSLLDENENVLQGNITYKTITKEITGEYVVFQKFSDLNPTFIVRIDNKIRYISTNVTSEVLNLYFDRTAPLITNVQSRVSNGKLVISAIFIDPGKYPSGLDGYPFITYFTNDSAPVKIKMYPSGSGRFEGSIPLISQSDINYTITVKDVQGNENRHSGIYTVTFKPEAEIEKATKSFSWVTVIGIFVFAIVIYVIYQKIREQSN